jgi:hypothetical protein
MLFQRISLSTVVLSLLQSSATEAGETKLLPRLYLLCHSLSYAESCAYRTCSVEADQLMACCFFSNSDKMRLISGEIWIQRYLWYYSPAMQTNRWSSNAIYSRMLFWAILVQVLIIFIVKWGFLFGISDIRPNR